MSLAPKGEEGRTSAFRTAATNLGTSMGTVFLATIFFSTATASMSDENRSTGLSVDRATYIAKAVIEGASSEEVASQYSVPVALVDEVTSYERQAAVEGFRAQGVGSGFMLLAAAGIFYVARRRIDGNEAAIERRVTEPV